MKPLITLLALLFLSTIACEAGVKKSLMGKWSFENGEGATKTVTELEFKENGEFSRHVRLGDKVFNETLSGKWQLTTDATGFQAAFADPNKLILSFQIMEASKFSGGIQAPVNKTEAWLVNISNDATFGKETLRLGPLDGTLLGTNYFFRAP